MCAAQRHPEPEDDDMSDEVQEPPKELTEKQKADLTELEEARRQMELNTWEKEGGREMRRFKLSQLNIDHSYQRELSLTFIRKMIAEFDVTMLRELEVNIRPNGTVYVIDGQHRLEALRAIVKNPEKYSVTCLCNHVPTVEEEAKLYLARGAYTRKIAYAQTWEARKTAGDQDAIALGEMIEAAGFIPVMKPTTAMQPGYMSTGAVERAIKDYGEAIAVETLYLLQQGYGANHSIPVKFYTGLASFISRFDDDPAYRQQRMIDLLQANPPNVIVRHGANAKELLQVSNAQGIALALYRAYNHKLKFKLGPFNT